MAVESSKSDSSEHLSLESEQKKGNGFLSPSFPTPSSRSLLNMQIQQRMRLLAGLLQELGQRRSHSALKRGRVSLESPSEGLAAQEEQRCVCSRTVLLKQEG